MFVVVCVRSLLVAAMALQEAFFDVLQRDRVLLRYKKAVLIFPNFKVIEIGIYRKRIIFVFKDALIRLKGF